MYRCLNVHPGMFNVEPCSREQPGTCVLHGKIILNRVGLWSVPVLHERGTSV